jgi:drug/metabolite transporter (DMT)-like permease
MTKTNKGIIYLLLAAFLYSIMPLFIRWLNAGNVPPMSQVFLRYIFAFLGASGYFYITKSKFKLETTTLPLLIITAVFGYALTNLFFTYGMIYTQVTTALFIFYSFAIITPLLAFIFLKEKANQYNWVGLGLSLLALLLLFQPNVLLTWKIGALFALLSALGQSFYLIARRKLMSYSSQQILLTSTFFGVVTLGIMALIFEKSFYFGAFGIKTLQPETWLLTVIFGLDNFFAWLFMSKGFQLVKASIGSLILLVENVFVVASSLVFLKEVPTIATIIGGMIILGTIALVTVKGDRS